MVGQSSPNDLDETMETSSLETVGIESILGSQNRGDENEYFISSVFDDSSELETAQETHGQSCLTSGISANINSRQPQDVTVGPPLPRRTSIRGRGNSPAVATEGASAVTRNRSRRAAQYYDSSLYPSASLDDVCAVPNSVTCIPAQSESSKEECGAVKSTDDTVGERSSTAQCSVTINFRITDEHFCCNSRESSLHLELEIGKFDGTRNGNAFPPQVSCQGQQTRQTARDGVLRVTSTLVTGSGATSEEVVDLHRPHPGGSAGMDDSDDFQGSPTLDGAETPEYSPTDSESSETSDEVDSVDQQTSGNHSGLDSHFETPTGEESYLARSEEVINEENKNSCADIVEAKSDTRQSDSSERQYVEENTARLVTEREEKCEPDSKEDADRNSMRSGLSLVSEDSSKTSVVCKTAFNKIDSETHSLPENCGNQPTATEEHIEEFTEEAFHSVENNCKEEEKVESGSPLQTSLDRVSNSSEVHSETVEEERVLGTEILGSSEDQDLTSSLKDGESNIEGEKVIAKELDDVPKAELVESPRDSETQGQGDTSLSHTDDTSSPGSEITEGTNNEHSLSNGEESKLKFPKTLEHVSEVPRGIFESILYKLYNRMNQRSPRAWRDISRGPCVKQLVKEFSKEAMECPKFPKSQSLHVRKTQEEIPKSQLLESSSDMDDSPKSHSARAQKAEEEIRKAPLSESFSDIDDRGFESRLETSTDDDHLSSDDVPIRSSTPSQEVVVLEIRDELQKPDCSSRRVLQLIKKFGGKGTFKKHKKSEDKVKTERLVEEQLQMKDVDEGSVNKDVTTDEKKKSEIFCDKDSICSGKESSAWLTNVSVKNLVSIFSEISTSPVLTRRSASRSSKKSGAWQSKDTVTKASRTMETQTPGSEPIGSCSNVLLLVQPEYAGNNMLGSRFERKRSTLSVCLPATADLEECDGEGGRLADPLRACASATGVLLVSTAEPVRLRALCSPDDNRTALTQLAHLLHMPERKAQAQARARSAARDSSLVRQMVAQWDRAST